MTMWYQADQRGDQVRETTRPLRQLRKLRGFTIRALAQRAGTGTQTIVRIEKGEPARLETFRKIAEALDVDMLDIEEFVKQALDD